MRILIQLGFVAISAASFSSESFAEFERKLSSSNLESGELQLGTTVRCESNQNIGFSWRNGEWKRFTFNDEIYIFKKLDHRSDEKISSEAMMCSGQIEGETDLVWGGFMWINRCYSVQELGGGEPEVMACKERYVDSDIVGVDCGGNAKLSFHPDEQLLISPHHRNVRSRPKDDYKDSFAIGVGKCGRL